MEGLECGGEAHSGRGTGETWTWKGVDCVYIHMHVYLYVHTVCTYLRTYILLGISMILIVLRTHVYLYVHTVCTYLHTYLPTCLLTYLDCTMYVRVPN